MKITRMKIKGKAVNAGQRFAVLRELNRRFAKAGFRTNVEPLTATALKVGLHMCSFRIDRDMHDRNLRHNPYTGTKLTDIPTWEQRVEFNNIVNAVLNKFKISASVRSGPFTIRDGLTACTESDWHNQKPEYILHNESRGWFIESCDEREYLEERRIARNKAARAKRIEAKRAALSVVSTQAEAAVEAAKRLGFEVQP